MSASITGTSDAIITISISGKISPEQLSSTQQLALESLRAMGGGAILCICDGFQGWTDGDWSDLSFQEQADPLIRRMAVVGERQWEGLAMAFTAQGIRPFPIGFFDTGRQDDARAWLHG